MLSKFSLLRLYLFTLLYWDSSQLPRRFDLKLHSYTCNSVSKTVPVMKCGFRKVAENHFLLFSHLMFSKKMSNNLYLHMFLNIKSHMKKEAIHFMDLKLKACDVLRTANENKMLEMISQELRRSTNFPFKCPFKENFLYKISNYSLTEEFASPFSPFVNFTYGFDYYDSKTLIGTTRVLGEIAQRTRREK